MKLKFSHYITLNEPPIPFEPKGVTCFNEFLLFVIEMEKKNTAYVSAQLLLCKLMPWNAWSCTCELLHVHLYYNIRIYCCTCALYSIYRGCQFLWEGCLENFSPFPTSFSPVKIVTAKILGITTVSIITKSILHSEFWIVMIAEQFTFLHSYLEFVWVDNNHVEGHAFFG